MTVTAFRADYTPSNTVTFTATIANVSPSGTLASSGPADEGSAVTVGFAAVSDPSPADTNAGLRYAFPRAMAALEPKYERVVALHDAIAARPRIAAYLASARRIAFNEDGIFRHYPELDAAP